MEADVDERPHQRLRDLRAPFVVKAKRHAVALEQRIGLWLVPRRMPEFHHVPEPPSPRPKGNACRKRLEERLEPVEVALKIPRELVEHGSESRTERLCAF